MDDTILRVITAYKRRSLGKRIVKRSPSERLKSRQYYRTHKSRVKFLRQRAKSKSKVYNRTKKLYKRTKPSWSVSKKRTNLAPKPYKPPRPKKPKKPKAYVPKRIKAKPSKE